jgi:hypothetical protein
MARESCAGSCILPIKDVIKLVDNAMVYIANTYGGGNAEYSLVYALEAIKRDLEQAKEYGDRLKPDNILCEILNQMLRDE